MPEKPIRSSELIKKRPQFDTGQVLSWEGNVVMQMPVQRIETPLVQPNEEVRKRNEQQFNLLQEANKPFLEIKERIDTYKRNDYTALPFTDTDLMSRFLWGRELLELREIFQQAIEHQKIDVETLLALFKTTLDVSARTAIAECMSEHPDFMEGKEQECIDTLSIFLRKYFLDSAMTAQISSAGEQQDDAVRPDARQAILALESFKDQSEEELIDLLRWNGFGRDVLGIDF